VGQFLVSEEKKNTKFLKKIGLQQIKIFSHYRFVGFYNASEQRTDWDLEKSLYSDYICFCLKRTYKTWAFGRNPFTLLSISPNPRVVMRQFSQTSWPVWYCRKFYHLHAKHYFPLSTSPHCTHSYRLLKLFKILHVKYAQALIKSKCAMTMTESVCQLVCLPL
jgi:hypothetical protein